MCVVVESYPCSLSCAGGQIQPLHRMRAVAVGCSEWSTAVLSVRGELFICGVHWPQGSMATTASPVQIHPRVPREPEWEFDTVAMRQVTCGQSHLAAIGADGTLFTWGEGEDGALGHENGFVGSGLPFQVEALLGQRVVKVSCGSSHTAAVTSTGELWTWGLLADGTMTDVPRRLLVFDSSDYPPEQLSRRAGTTGSRVVDVACGYNYTVIRLASGELQTLGGAAATHLKLRFNAFEATELPEGQLRQPQVVDDRT